MRWFGKTWNAPINLLLEVKVPIGELCLFCELPIEREDRGVMLSEVSPSSGGILGEDWHVVARPAHLLCFFRNTVGPLITEQISVQLP